MTEPLDLKQIVAGDINLQRTMHSTYVSYMVRKGCNRDEIMVFSEWQRHFDFPVTDETERFSGQKPQRFFGRKTGQFYSWTRGPRAN